MNDIARARRKREERELLENRPNARVDLWRDVFGVEWGMGDAAPPGYPTIRFDNMHPVFGWTPGTVLDAQGRPIRREGDR